MLPFGIVWPTVALAAVIFVVWFTLLFQRLGHMKVNPPTAESFADGAAARDYFRPVEMPANNLANLFELPVLYFALVPLLLLTRQASELQGMLAWIFAGLRAVHSFVHIGPKNVRLRFFVYLLSCAVLLAMWIGFAVDFAHAEHAYHQAMRGLPINR